MKTRAIHEKRIYVEKFHAVHCELKFPMTTQLYVQGGFHVLPSANNTTLIHSITIYSNMYSPYYEFSKNGTCFVVHQV